MKTDIEIADYIDKQENSPYSLLYQQFLSLLLSGDRHGASSLILNQVESGTPVKDIYLHVFQASQYEIGRLWEINRISVAQEHFCTAATQLVMSQLYSHVFSTEKTGYRMIAASIGGELHEIGIRMVADFFEMAGWDTYYMGANTPTDTIIQAIRSLKTDLLALSVSMPFNLNDVVGVIRRVHEELADSNIKILVGGRPFNVSRDLWTKVGADGYAPNAEEAIIVADRLIKKLHDSEE
ncbi:MAG: cobalamin B12-binding domain-containing protein [Spirochaetota bacterium]